MEPKAKYERRFMRQSTEGVKISEVIFHQSIKGGKDEN
jgi:hypothetical protein